MLLCYDNFRFPFINLRLKKTKYFRYARAKIGAILKNASLRLR